MLKYKNAITQLIQSHFALAVDNNSTLSDLLPRADQRSAKDRHSEQLSNKSNNILLGKPNYKTFLNKIVIQVPYFMNKEASMNNATKKDMFTQLDLQSLGTALQTYIASANRTLGDTSSKQISSIKAIADIRFIELRFIQLQYPYLDRTILSQFIAINAGKYNFNRIQKNLFHGMAPWVTADLDTLRSLSDSIDQSKTRNEVVPFNVSGVKMELAGRLITQRRIPRKTVSTAHTGSFTSDKTSKHNTYLDTSQYTSKNKTGSFTIKIGLYNKK